MASDKTVAEWQLEQLSSGENPFIPTGGTTGQVLRKSSSGNYALEWATPAAGGEAFPVGSVFIAVVATNPATLLGYGTWSAFAAGRVLVGLDAGQTEFDTVEETGGARTHTLTTAEIPTHNHSIRRERSATTGGDTTQIARTADATSTIDAAVTTENAGGGGSHNNLQPYIVVYIWKRTA